MPYKNKRKKQEYDKNRSPLYRCWVNLRNRCTNPNNPKYPLYGGRGINVCEAWNKFVAFENDMLPAWRPGLQLDRIDNNKGYHPNNCQWVTPSANMKNRRNQIDQKSEIDNVSFDKRQKKWVVKKTFRTKEEAERWSCR